MIVRRRGFGKDLLVISAEASELTVTTNEHERPETRDPRHAFAKHASEFALTYTAGG